LVCPDQAELFVSLNPLFLIDHHWISEDDSQERTPSNGGSQSACLLFDSRRVIKKKSSGNWMLPELLLADVY
jgi:hypothetical protein